jgi:iron complex outermembrane receptor protein
MNSDHQRGIMRGAAAPSLANMRGGRLAAGLALTLFSVGHSAMAIAQTSTDAQSAPQAQSASIGVEEIIVTATRRSQDLQKVAGTVQALPAKTLEQLGITSVLQLTNVVPGFTVVPTGGNNLYLRGIGTNSAGYNEAQVAVYLDGLYLANPAMGIYSFNNIDQIEVLKGPQGTLYGRNVTAGLVSVKTRDPGSVLRVDASIGYANYDTFTQNFYISTPITDTLAANVAVYNSKQNDGWGKNLFTGRDIYKSRETGVETKLKWEPTPATKVTATFVYDTNNRDSGLNFQVVPGTTANDGTTYSGKYNTRARVVTQAPFNAYIGLLKIQHELDFANLTSLTGYQTSRQRPVFPANTAQLGQPLAGQGTTFLSFRQRNRTWSQELQLASKPSDDRLDWLLGAFYYNDNTTIEATTFGTCVAGLCAPGGAAPNILTGKPTTRSYSGFADVSYRVFDATHLTVGLRYTDETKGLSGSTVPLAGFPNSVTTLPPSTVIYPGQPFGTNPGIPTKLHFTKLTYRFVLAQDIGSNVRAYISNNLGFKSGAFNANVFSNNPVRPETLDAYEAGVKAQLFDRKLRLNVAYFYYDYKDVQLRSTAPPAPAGTAILQNVAAVRSKGVDVDFSLVPTAGLTINGGFEILDAKYTRFPGATCSSPGPTGRVVSVSCDLSGRKVAYAAPFSATLGFTYNLDTTFGGLSIAANLNHAKRHTLQPDGSIIAPTANLVDSSITWTSPDKHYDVRLYARNLTNEYTYVSSAVSPNSFAYIPGAPRQYGITVGLHY